MHIALGSCAVCKAVLNVDYRRCGNVLCRESCGNPIAVCCNVCIEHSVLSNLLRNLCLALALIYNSCYRSDICVVNCAIKSLSIYYAAFAVFANARICICCCTVRIRCLFCNYFVRYLNYNLLNIHRISFHCRRIEVTTFGVSLLISTCVCIVYLTPLVSSEGTDNGIPVHVVVITHRVNVRQAIYVVLCRLCDEVCNVKIIKVGDSKSNRFCNSTGCKSLSIKVTHNVDSTNYPTVVVLNEVSVIYTTVGYKMLNTVLCRNSNSCVHIAIGSISVVEAVLNVHYHARRNISRFNNCLNLISKCLYMCINKSVLVNLCYNRNLISFVNRLIYVKNSRRYICDICMEDH